MVYMVAEPDYTVREGKYIGELIQVSELETQYGPALRFLFKLAASDNGDFGSDFGDGFVLSGLCNSRKLMPGTKFYDWISVLNGENLDIGDKVDPEDFMGHKVELIVENSDKDGQRYSNVARLVRLVDPLS